MLFGVFPVVPLLLLVWMALVLLVAPVLTFFGLSEQVAVGAVSVLFFVAFWAVGLWILFAPRFDYAHYDD